MRGPALRPSKCSESPKGNDREPIVFWQTGPSENSEERKVLGHRPPLLLMNWEGVDFDGFYKGTEDRG